MKRRHLSLCFAALLMVLIGTSSSPGMAALAVVTSTPDLAVVARSVGGDRVRVEALAPFTRDPHGVEAKPHLALALARAELLLITGAELEASWLPTLQTASRNGAVQVGAGGFLDCSTLVELIEVPGKVDRSMGDVHPSGNPHYMLDPRAVERVAVGVGKRLAALDPAGREHYLARTKAFVAELRRARDRWERALAGLRGTNVVTYHRSLAYLARWIGFTVVEQVEPKAGIPPNPRHVAHVIETARATRARLLVQESWFPTDPSKTIADAARLRLAVIRTMPNFEGGESYVAFLDRVLHALTGAP